MADASGELSLTQQGRPLQFPELKLWPATGLWLQVREGRLTIEAKGGASAATAGLAGEVAQAASQPAQFSQPNKENRGFGGRDHQMPCCSAQGAYHMLKVW